MSPYFHIFLQKFRETYLLHLNNSAFYSLIPYISVQVYESQGGRHHQIPTSPMYWHFGNTTVLLVAAVRNFGVYPNADISMAARVTTTVRTCCNAPTNTQCASFRLLSGEALQTLIRAPEVSNLDYCNSVLVSVTGTLLQSVFNPAPRLHSQTHNATPLRPSLTKVTAANPVLFIVFFP